MAGLARTAWRVIRAPVAWVGPEAARSGKGAYRRTRVLLTLAVAIANFVGAVVVFVFAAWVVPNPEIADSTRVIVANLIAFGIYMAVSLAIGISWGARRLKRAREWLEEERDPDEREQKTLVRGPLRIAFVAAVLWLLAVVVFAGLNAAFEPGLGLVVGLTVGLGGITTSAVAYLLSERLLRALSARALASRPPDKPLVPGVIFRNLLAWALGTAVPIVGLLIVAVFGLAGDEDVTREQLSLSILGLGGISLVVGWLAAVLAARAASDPVASVREAQSKVEEGDLDVEVPVYDGSEIGLLQAGFNRMVDGLRERQEIREKFGAYVDHEVAEHILEEGVSLEGEEVDVTLLFLDVRDFTSWVEDVEAGQVVDTLNRLFDLVVPIVHENGGHVDKFVGDGLLAVFGAPRRDEQHADHAFEAARRIAEGVEKEDGLDLEIGIGLNSGRVVAGNVGGGGRLEFSVVGDAVNVAARIEASTRETGDTILLSQETADRLGSAEDGLESRSEVELKGKREPVRLYAPGNRD